jgi:hypothetical protein
MPDQKVTASAKPHSAGKAFIAFFLVGFVWLATIMRHTLGFVPPTNGQAIGFDTWGLLMWAAFIYTVVNLVKAFRHQ